jgi:hypothetical protein
VIGKGELCKYVIALTLVAVAVLAVSAIANEGVIQVRVLVQGLGPLSNASLTYMEFTQSYNTQMLYSMGQVSTNGQGVAEIPQPLPGRYDIVVITVNATIRNEQIMRTYTYYLTNENFTNELNITIPAPQTGGSESTNLNVLGSDQLFIVIVALIIIVAVIAVILLVLTRSRARK